MLIAECNLNVTSGVPSTGLFICSQFCPVSEPINGANTIDMALVSQESQLK